MIQLFNTNNPSVVALYLLYIVVFRLFYFFNPSLPIIECKTGYTALELFLPAQLNPIISLIIGGIIVFFQAILVNRLILVNKLTRNKQFIGGALFILFSSFFKEFLFFSEFQIAFSFLLIAKYRTFRLIGKEKPFRELFDIGTFLSLASLSYFPFVVFLLMFLIWLAILRPFSIKEYVLIFIGLLSPFYLLFCVNFLLELNINFGRFGSNYFSFFSYHQLLIHYGNIASSIAIILFIGVAVLGSQNVLFSGLIQIRKQASCLYVQVVFIFTLVLITQNCSFLNLALFSFPLSLLVMLIVYEIKSFWISESIHLILILTVLFNQYYYLIF